MNAFTYLAAVLASFTQCSCTHITMLGHKTAYDVNAEFSGDPIAPVSLNAGFEGRTFAAVPPREAVDWNDNFLPGRLPKGDVMSSLLDLKIEKLQRQGANGTSNVVFDYVTSGATGLAADAATGAGASDDTPFKNNPAKDQLSAEEIETSAKISDITNKPGSIPGL